MKSSYTPLFAGHDTSTLAGETILILELFKKSFPESYANLSTKELYQLVKYTYERCPEIQTSPVPEEVFSRLVVDLHTMMFH